MNSLLNTCVISVSMQYGCVMSFAFYFAKKLDLKASMLIKVAMSKSYMYACTFVHTSYMYHNFKKLKS